ncbi:MAG: glycoside hydrolase [Marivirga sp.]|nr:glycoside hydrolase [Marivirga sp.]
MTGLFILLTGVFTSSITRAQDKWERVVNLEGNWKFSIGDKSIWRDRYFNDAKWEGIYVPSKWEDEGFNGYNGYAWYRKSFDGPDLESKELSFNLFLGYIDDVDEVYFNGHKIGSSGSFPPRFHTAYNAARNYFIPREYIDFAGKNVIAVRVYDSEIEGGIVSGDVGIYTSKADRGLAVNLRGVWDFKVASAGRNRFLSVNEDALGTLTKDGWVDITVPGAWENQGYGNYDGGAWYKKEFIIPKEMLGEDLVLLLGKIDDSDKTFLNGKLIGSSQDKFDKQRIYFISKDQFKAGSMNTLIVFVDDPHGYGGIYEGPVGLMKQGNFTKYIRWK